MNKLERMPIKIALFGMDVRSIARMATIFKVVYKERCDVTPGEQANLAIVDLDGDTEAWDKFQQQFPNLPTIVMSESPSSTEGAIYIAKPAKLNLLWESILRLVIGLPSPDEFVTKPEFSEQVSDSEECNTATSTITDIDDAPPSVLPESVQSQGEAINTEHSFNPDVYLLGRLLTTLRECSGRECRIDVSCSNSQRLMLFPHLARAWTDLDDESFQHLAEMPDDDEFAVELTEAATDPSREMDGLHSMPIDYLLWDLAQRTACGRVPLGTDLSKPFFLRCWPNFPRLPNTLHGMRIASLWVGEPRTLDDIATSLGIETTEVYSFYSAAFAIGLAGTAKRQVDGLLEPRRVIKKDVLKRDVRNAILRYNLTT